jgi:hypothetical protein
MELQQQLDQSNQEIEFVRQKLHNAVRKGKAIEAASRLKETQLQQVSSQLAAIQAELEEARCVSKMLGGVQRIMACSSAGLQRCSRVC